MRVLKCTLGDRSGSMATEGKVYFSRPQQLASAGVCWLSYLLLPGHRFCRPQLPSASLVPESYPRYVQNRDFAAKTLEKR